MSKFEIGNTVRTVSESYGINDGLNGESSIPAGMVGTVIEVLPDGVMVTFNGQVWWEHLTNGEGICYDNNQVEIC